jgi:hypothetical protein
MNERSEVAHSWLLIGTDTSGGPLVAGPAHLITGLDEEKQQRRNRNRPETQLRPSGNAYEDRRPTAYSIELKRRSERS